MGYARRRPERLAEKLARVRAALGLSQNELIRRLGFEDLTQNRISEYELGKNDPPLMVLLQYARLAGVHTEALIDDDLDLPDKLPGPVNHNQIRHAYKPHTKKRQR